MFNSISGKLTQKGRDSVFVTTHGVEWEILTSTSSLDDLPEIGGDVKMWVHLWHREMAMQLYGFAAPEERAVFLELLKVDGMGPRLALRVLSGMRARDLARAVRDRDTATLSRVPGIGPKTAEKMVLALSGKLITEDSGDAVGGPSVTGDLATALTAMGFDRREALKALQTVLERLAPRRLSPEDLEKEALRDAIRLLGGAGG